MSTNENNLLIDHLDKSLEGKELEAVQQLLRNNEEMAKEWQLLQFTASNVYEAGLYAHVGTIRDQYNATKNNADVQTTKRGVVRTMTQKMMRVAAVLFFMMFSTAVYKYISVNDSGVYNKYYSSYELNTSRGQGSDDNLDNAYRDRKWMDVITIVNGIQDKNSKHLFLAGVANLELKKFETAINFFRGVLNNNQVSGDDYFGDEAEYYLAMSYLANNESDKALPILQKIKNDSGHLYNQAVSKMGLDVKILQLKDRK